MERAKEGICELVLSWEKVRSIRYSLDKVLGIVNAWPDAPGQKTVVAILNSINTQLTPKGHPFSTSELLEVNQGTQPHEQRTLSTFVERFFAPVTTSKTKVFSAAPSSSSTTSSPSSCFSLEEKQALYRQLTGTNEEKESKKDKRRRLYLAEGVEESNETAEKITKEDEALLTIVGATQKAERAKNARRSMKRRWTASDEEREEEEAEQEQVIPVAAMDEVKAEEKPTKECNVNEQRRGKEESEEENLSAMVLVKTRQQTEPNDFNSFSMLPAEMCTDIFMRLSIAEWNAMAKVSKGFRAYFTSDAFWGSVKHFTWSPFHQQQLSSNFFSTCVPHMHRLQSLHINGTCFSKNKEACLNFFLNNLPLPSSPSSSSSPHANTKERERERGLSTLVLRNYRLTDFRISSIAHRCGPYLRRLSLGEDCGGLHVEPLLNLLRCCSPTLRSLTFGCLASAAETQRFLDAAAALCGGRLQELNILLTRCQPVLSLVSVAQHCRSRPRSRDRCYRWNNEKEEEEEEEEGGLRLLSVLGMPLEGQGLTLVEGLPAVLKRCGRRLERCQFTNICFTHVYEEEVTSPTTSFSSLRTEEQRNGEEGNEEEGNDVRTLKRRRRERRTRTRSRSSSLTSTLPPPTHSSPQLQQSEHQEGGEEDEETIIRRDVNAWKMLERMPRLEELWLEGLFGRSATTFIRLLQTDHCPHLRVLSLPSVGTFAIQDIIRIVENHQPEGDEEEKGAENERSRGRRGLSDVLLHDCSLVGPEEAELLHQRFPRIRFRTPTLFPPYLRREGQRGAAPASFS